MEAYGFDVQESMARHATVSRCVERGEEGATRETAIIIAHTLSGKGIPE